MKRICSLSLTFLILFSVASYAGVEVKKSFNEAYNTTENTSLQVSNRFGSIVIENTTDENMSINVEVRVEAPSERKAQDILDQIDIIINKVGHTVSAYTEIDNAKWRGNVNVNIDYHILMPAHVDTKLEMKYGNVDIDQLTGRFNAEVKYGIFKANRIESSDGDLSHVELAYCDGAFMGLITHMKLDLAYSDCRIMRGEALDFDAKYSDLEIGDIHILKGEVGYGDIEIETTVNAKIEVKYSDFSIDFVKESLEIEAKYTDIEVDEVAPAFSLIKIETAYGDVDVDLGQANCQVYLETTYGDLHHPQMMVSEQDRESNSRYIKGFIGSNDSASRVNIVGRYADLDLR